MKRELKGVAGATSPIRVKRFTHHPDEEGTESRGHHSLKQTSLKRFTHHPDEEGTERQDAGLRHPDFQASHTIPMKRELKGYRSVLARCSDSWLHTPSR